MESTVLLAWWAAPRSGSSREDLRFANGHHGGGARQRVATRVRKTQKRMMEGDIEGRNRILEPGASACNEKERDKEAMDEDGEGKQSSKEAGIYASFSLPQHSRPTDQDKTFTELGHHFKP